MTLADTIKKDLLTIEADLGNQIFTWDGADYICVPSSSKITTIVKEGAWVNVRLATLAVRTNQFADGVFPVGLDYITYKTSRWCISSVDKDSTGALLILTIIEDNRGVHG